MVAASAYAPAASAQTFQPTPLPKPGQALVQSSEIYPRASAEVEIAAGLKVKPLKTVQTKAGKAAVADRLIVGFAKGLSDSEQHDAHLKAAGRISMAAKPVKKLGPQTELVDVSGAKSLEAAIDAYRADPRVRLAAPDLLMRETETPNDTQFGQQANMTRIQAPAAWNRTHGSLSRRIAILDTGIDLSNTNADLTGRVVASVDFSGSPFGATDKRGHGTHVAGIAGAVTNNNFGVAGVAWNTQLLNAKVLDDTGAGSISMLIDGIRWAVANGADVINMSVGADQSCNPSAWEDLFDTGRNELQDAINEAFAANVVLVAAAGNNGNSNENWPASCPNVVSVASTDNNDARSGFSNFGTWVDVAAPGSNIFSTALPLGSRCANGTAQFAMCSGTSMASPHVAGLAVLVKQSCNLTSASSIVGRIQATSDQIAGTGASWIFGRINALRAVCFPAPSNLHLGNVTTNSIELLWTDGGAPADSSTEVHFRPHNTATWSVQVLAANRTQWLHQGLSAGSGWDYKVRDCDANGCSAFSNQVTGYAGTTGHTLTVNKIGTGSVTSQPAGINCGSDCSDVYANGTQVALEAHDGFVNGAEWVFKGWSGACSGQNYTCTVTMNAAKSVTARFNRTSE
jgi:thermitase